MKSEKEARYAEANSTIVLRTENAEREPSKDGPTPEEIRLRAFEIHIERGGIHGCDLDDWMEAEHELQKKYKNGTTRPKNG